MDSQPSRSSGRFETSPSTSNNTPFLTKSTSDASSSSSSPHSQSLASILNNPHAGKSDGFWWWSTSSSIPTPDFLPLSSLPKPGSDTRLPDFQSYLFSISEPYARFHDIQQHARSESLEDQEEQNALVACLKEVPALYFKEDFKLEDGATFKAACPFRTIAENLVTQEKLSQYLDVVELHLVREISLRSNSFFEAQGQLEDLNSKIVEGCDRIRELKETIRLLDDDLVGSARKVQELNVQRSELIAHQDKLKLILYVNQAISTLKLVNPKNYGAEELKDFRPKSLTGGVYKIISKLIAERLKTVMRRLMDERKMTFLNAGKSWMQLYWLMDWWTLG